MARAARDEDEEIALARRKAFAAGARHPIDYVGRGMTGVVFRDARGRGYKVARNDRTARHIVGEEAEWLRAASPVPELRRHIARLVRYHRGLGVIEREHIAAAPVPYGYSGKRRLLWEEIVRVMKPYGWSAPEYKEDSFVYARGRGWVLVDAGFVHRKGTRLAARAGEVLRGRRFHGEKPSDLAWQLRMEGGRTLPERTAEHLSRRLLDLPDAERMPTRGEFRDRPAPRRRRSR